MLKPAPKKPGGLKKGFLWPFGPQFGLKMRGGGPQGPSHESPYPIQTQRAQGLSCFSQTYPESHKSSLADEQANGSADFENIFAQISDSERNFHAGFVDLPMAADCGFNHFLSPDFGICILLVFRIQREISSANLKINHNHPIMALDHNGSADLHTCIHSLLINIHSRPR